MAGEWIPGKAEGLMGEFFPGPWESVGEHVFQGRCPGEHLHTGGSAATDCRIHTAYGAQKQPPGIYCLHASCKGVLEDLNERFRAAIFAKDENFQGGGGGQGGRGSASPNKNAGVVERAPFARESWIPDFNIGKLRHVVKGVEEIGADWFVERSPLDPRKMTPGEFLEHMFRPAERVLVCTVFKGQGEYLWEVGRGGFRLAESRGVKAVKSALPVDGGKDGVWFLTNPVDGQWHANPRRQGRYSRRSEESVTAWRHLVVESDEEKNLRKKGYALAAAERLRVAGAAGWEASAELLLTDAKAGEKWVKQQLEEPERWATESARYHAEAKEMPGLWNRLLAMAPLTIKAIYSSGGDSWHALVDVNQPTKADFDTLLRNWHKRQLPLLGADPGAMTPVRLSRLAGCTRGGKEQRLIYCNPNPDPEGVPIRDLPRVRRVSTKS